MLFRIVIAFLLRSKHLNFVAAVTICSDFEAPKNKVSHCFHCLPIYLPRSDGTGCHDQTRQCIEKQGHDFANKGPSSQGLVFLWSYMDVRVRL